jgi:hypothetical protein
LRDNGRNPAARHAVFNKIRVDVFSTPSCDVFFAHSRMQSPGKIQHTQRQPQQVAAAGGALSIPNGRIIHFLFKAENRHARGAKMLSKS